MAAMMTPPFIRQLARTGPERIRAIAEQHARARGMTLETFAYQALLEALARDTRRAPAPTRKTGGPRYADGARKSLQPAILGRFHTRQA